MATDKLVSNLKCLAKKAKGNSTPIKKLQGKATSQHWLNVLNSLNRINTESALESCVICFTEQPAHGILGRNSTHQCSKNEPSTCTIMCLHGFEKQNTLHTLQIQGTWCGLADSILCQPSFQQITNTYTFLGLELPQRTGSDLLGPSESLQHPWKKQALDTDLRIKGKVLYIFRPQMEMHFYTWMFQGNGENKLKSSIKYWGLL